MIDALLPAAKDPAKLKFRTLWNNVTIGTVIMNGFPRAALTGTDALTGFDCVTDIQSFFGASAVLEMHYYLEDTTKRPVGTQPLPAPDVADQLEATIVSSTLTSIANANDLQLDYKYRATTPGKLSFPQIWLNIYRTGAATKADVDEMYMSFIYELPADLATRLVSGGQNYLAIWDWKTDGYLSQDYGDLRLKAEILKSVDGRLYWNFAIDNDANGWSIVPSVATSFVTYQSVRFDDTNIPLGEPFKFEVYFRRPAKINTRSTVKESGATAFRYEQDLENGIFRAGITILSTGEFLPLCNFVGGRMMGAENLSFGRCMQGMYTPGTPPMTYKIGDWQIWDSIPAHSSLSKRYTYNRAKFYAPLTSTTTLSKGKGSPTFTRTTACWEYIDGVLTQISSGNPRIRSDRGIGINPNQTINTLRYCRDLTQSQVWKVSGYGANLVSNGSFDSGVSGWTGSGTAVVTHSSGQLSLQMVEMVGGSDTAYTAISCTVGVRYVVQVSVASGMGSARYLIGTTAGGSQVGIVGQTTSGAAETFFSVFTATATTHYISLTVNTAATRLFDNVSVYAAGVTTALNQTGLDNVTNSCTLLTAAINDATISQTITAAAAAGCSGFKVKRSVGTGPIYFSRDGGTSWLDITSEINASDFSLVKIENTSVTNPQIMFKIATSGDAIIVDAGINHLGTKIASCPILTTNASVTVNAETLTYPTTYNIETSQGTILATFTADSYSSGMGNIVGSSTAGLATSSSYTCQAKDGTNTVNGSAASPSGTIKIGMAWNARLGTMQAIGENGIETNGTYDGSLGLSTIAILPSVDGYIKDVAYFNIVLANSEVQSVFNS